jgi:hypothetical protein
MVAPGKWPHVNRPILASIQGKTIAFIDMYVINFFQYHVLDSGCAVVARLGDGSRVDRLAKIGIFSASGLLGLAGNISVCSASDIIPTNFNAYGTTATVFQDFFSENASTFESNYTEISNSATVATGSSGNFTLDTSNQVLEISGNSGNPNKLLYSGATYDTSNQTVLAEIAVTDSNASNSNLGDGWRGGVATVSDPSNGTGINQVFRTDGDNGPGNHTNFLNDGAAWDSNAVGSGLTYGSTPVTYYWLELTTTTDAGGNEITGKIWLADGTTPESDAQTGTWNRAGEILDPAWPVSSPIAAGRVRFRLIISSLKHRDCQIFLSVSSPNRRA